MNISGFVLSLLSVSISPPCTLGDLYGDIMQTYRKQLFPTWDKPDEKFILTVQTYPTALIDFAEREGKITLMCNVYLNWTDQRLAWNQSFYNLNNLAVTTDDIWLPYLFLVNNVNGEKPVGYGTGTYVNVFFDGTVIWSPGTLLEANCSPNVQRFPFDKQTCEFIFNMLGVSPFSFNLVVLSEEVISDYMSPNSNWELVDTKQYMKKTQSVNQYHLEIIIKRHSMYYVVTVLIPTLLFTLMNPLVFCLPVDSGERVSLGMTILLAYTIFLTIVSSSIPELSNPVCVVIIVLVLIMVGSGIIVLLTIASSHYYYMTNIDGVNKHVKWLVSTLVNRKNNEIAAFDKDVDVCPTNMTGHRISQTLDVIFCALMYTVFILILLSCMVFIFT